MLGCGRIVIYTSVVRVPTAKIGGLGFDYWWLPRHFLSVTTSSYHQWQLRIYI